MATRLEKQGTLQRAHGYPQATGGRLRQRRRIRLYDGSPRAAVRAQTASRAEASGALKRIKPRMNTDRRNGMPIHVAITRRVRAGCEAEFQQALREFFQTSFGHGGVW